MIYTSGATADPKAVVHTHGAQIRHAWSLAQLYGFTEDVRTFTTMPFFWVGGLTVCLLSHLHVGAAVITVERMDPPAMVELIERERATRLVGWTLLDRITGDPALADRDLSWLVGDGGIRLSPRPRPAAQLARDVGDLRPAHRRPPRPRRRWTCPSGYAARSGHRCRACSTRWSIPRTPRSRCPTGSKVTSWSVATA